MKGLQVHAGYLHEAVSNEVNPPTGFEAMEGEQAVGGGEEREIWLQREQEDLLDAADASIFYGDFSPLPDFPCMSASSSSSSTPAPVKAITSSSSSSSSASSSAASWAVLKSETEEDERKRGNHNQHVALHNYEHDNSQQDPVDGSAAALSSTGSMEIPQPSDHQEMDVIETFGYMDLLESNDLFDPSIFHSDVNLLEDFAPEQRPQEQPPPVGNEEMMQRKNDGTQQGGAGTGGGASDDLAEVFLEWLKSNKETVSAEDLRRVKLKKATIECAAKRLGGGKEAMKQLLKLILEWVQTNHLQRRRMRESSSSCLPYQYQEPLQNPNPNSCPIPNPNLDYNTVQPDQSNPCFNQNPWMAPVPYVPDPAAVMPGYPPIVGYMGDPFVNGASNVNGSPYPTPPDYQMLDSAHSWSASQFALPSLYSSFAENNLQSAPIHNPAFSGYGNQYPPYQFLTAHGDSRLARLGSSATKEARKKRMARQRRFLSHHRNHNHQNNQSQNSHQSAEPHARLGNDYANPTGQGNPGNWGYWSTSASGAVSVKTPGVPTDSPPVNNVDRQGMLGQNYQRQLAASDRRQGWKPEKNLRFLLQKVLKQSDVGNLGRIVLPKKEAETHLPELEARDGISIAMEDIGTSRVWNMRYRFWPNNKSRMYLLENTGDFVRTNGLQEGDFIVIYSDVKCGKYMIRGVKVRQPAGAKSEIKRAGKSQKSSHANSPSAVNGSPSTPNTQNQTVK